MNGRHCLTRILILTLWGASALHGLDAAEITPDDLLTGARLGVSPDSVVLIDDAEQRVREAVPTARWIYVEPDLHGGPAPTPGA